MSDQTEEKSTNGGSTASAEGVFGGQKQPGSAEKTTPTEVYPWWVLLLGVCGLAVGIVIVVRMLPEGGVRDAVLGRSLATQAEFAGVDVEADDLCVGAFRATRLKAKSLEVRTRSGEIDAESPDGGELIEAGDTPTPESPGEPMSSEGPSPGAPAGAAEKPAGQT